MKKSVFFSLALFLLISCSDHSSQNVEFKKEDYGAKWPFTVDKIEAFCAGLGKDEVYIKAGENIYALNGHAQRMAENRKSTQTFDTYKDIWADDPQHPGDKIPVPLEFISKTLENCK